MRTIAWMFLTTACFAVLEPACGADNGKKRVMDARAGEGGDLGDPSAAAGAGGRDDIGGSGGALSEGGAAAHGGSDASSDGGHAGAATPPSCEETCLEGACVLGECMGVTILEDEVNLTTTALSPGRDCAEAPAYSVVTLQGASAQLLTAPDSDCLAAGDEVLLINLQGSPGAVENVGSWELLRLASVDGAELTFTDEKQRFYGGAAESDEGLGTTPGTQRVALVRVPRFGVLDVTDSGSLTAAAWNGQLGGVLALRAGKLQVAGRVDASALGYRPGRWSEDNIVCAESIQTEAGESISGPGASGTARNEGASGGLSAGEASFNTNTPVMATPGHASSGEPGTNGGTRTVGPPGAAYGTGDGTRLTMGSGPGGGLRCTEEDHPVRLVSVPGQAGGIVLLLADEVEVAETGSISASPPPALRDVAFAGGYVLIRGQHLALGADRVTARGSIGGGVNGPTASFENEASSGYVVLQAADIEGSTDPNPTISP